MTLQALANAKAFAEHFCWRYFRVTISIHFSAVRHAKSAQVHTLAATPTRVPLESEAEKKRNYETRRRKRQRERAFKFRSRRIHCKPFVFYYRNESTPKCVRKPFGGHTNTQTLLITISTPKFRCSVQRTYVVPFIYGFCGQIEFASLTPWSAEIVWLKFIFYWRKGVIRIHFAFSFICRRFPCEKWEKWLMKLRSAFTQKYSIDVVVLFLNLRKKMWNYVKSVRRQLACAFTPTMPLSSQWSFGESLKFRESNWNYQLDATNSHHQSND